MQGRCRSNKSVVFSDGQTRVDERSCSSTDSCWRLFQENRQMRLPLSKALLCVHRMMSYEIRVVWPITSEADEDNITQRPHIDGFAIAGEWCVRLPSHDLQLTTCSISIFSEIAIPPTVLAILLFQLPMSCVWLLLMRLCMPDQSLQAVSSNQLATK